MDEIRKERLRRSWFLLSAPLCLAVCTSFGCGAAVVETPVETIVVRIPPMVDLKLTAGENQCVFEYWWHPAAQDADLSDIVTLCNDARLPNGGVPLFVELLDDDSLTLNGQILGKLNNVGSLTTRLKEIFEERRNNAVFEPHSSEVEKSVALRISGRNRTYSDLILVARSVKESGATQIILILEGRLPTQLIRPELVL